MDGAAHRSGGLAVPDDWVLPGKVALLPECHASIARGCVVVNAFLCSRVVSVLSLIHLAVVQAAGRR